MENPFPDRVTYVGHTRIELTAASGDRAEATMEIDDIHHQPYGVVHGGVYATMVETLASTGASFWAIEQGMAGAMGLSNTTDFLRATRSGVLLGVATPIHRGRNQQLWEVSITRVGDGKLAAHGQVRLQNIHDTESVGS
jgi:1,4-dihydroxy-2-naphthoyl-CoA hydrolase